MHPSSRQKEDENAAVWLIAYIHLFIYLINRISRWAHWFHLLILCIFRHLFRNCYRKRRHYRPACQDEESLISGFIWLVNWSYSFAYHGHLTQFFFFLISLVHWSYSFAYHDYMTLVHRCLYFMDHLVILKYRTWSCDTFATMSLIITIYICK